jgi:hypothetical protein
MSWSKSTRHFGLSRGALSLGAALLFVPALFSSIHCNPDAPPNTGLVGDGGDDGMDGEGGGDKTPPTFAGVKTVTDTGETGLSVSWDPAFDDVSPPAKIVYKVYLSTTVGTFDFTLPPQATSPAGTTTVLLEGLAAATTYSVLVHAVDEAGNEDANKVHLERSTKDFTPPVFAGAKSMTPTGATTADVAWAPATDNGTTSDKIKYRVYVTETPGAEDYTTPAVTSAPGATTATVTGLLESKTYYAVVRAVDASGNADSNTVEVSSKTLDRTPPTFLGLQSAIVGGTSVTLKWAAATDTIDPSSAIVYDVFQAKAAGTEDFTKPSYTTAAGALTYTVLGLDVSTKYFFVVRARDTSGNRDGNKIEKNVTTADSRDTNPPTFAGLVSATATGATTVDLAWAAATDDLSPVSTLVYDIYFATSAGGEDYTTPRFTSAAGATTFKVTGLTPSTPYYFVVRARDQAGNRETNTIEKTATTAGDTNPPLFGGLVSAAPTSPTAINLTWAAATDDVSIPGTIRYRVFRGTSAGGEDFTTPVMTTGGGVTSVVVNSLTPSTPYFFVVRALDEAGNIDANTVEKSATTNPDVTAPTFAGVATFVPTSPSTALVTWSPATDNVDPSSAIVYEIYLATAPGGEPLLPTVTTAAGATSYTLTGLTPATTYYVIVRARDTRGNVDTNTVEKSATLGADTTPPTFGGATGVTGGTSTSLTVNWLAASDAVTPASAIKYYVCMSTLAGSCSSSFVPTGAAVTGVLSRTFTGLTPTTTYYFVVRAEDAAGNRDVNTVEVSGVTVNDAVPPVFGGLTSASGSSPTSVTLSWTAATDNISTPAQIVYDIYMSSTPGGEVYTTPSFSSAAGATNYLVTGLTPTATYYFVVRARDTAGNHDSNTTEKSVTLSSDTTAPVFAGATSVTALSPTSLQVNWSAATDDTTPVGSIVYLVCYSTSPTGCNGVPFSSFSTTAAGATSYTVSGVGVLLPSTTYYFVVRARDTTGNTDTNVVVRSAATQADVTAPSFGTGPNVIQVKADTVASSQQLDVNWGAASDASYLSSALVYDLCWATPSGCAAFIAGGAATFTTAAGATSTSLTGLTSRTTYTVYVRARDPSNNRSSVASGSNTTATSYTNDINLNIFANTGAGGCNKGGCHNGTTFPIWTRANTVGVASTGLGSCTSGQILITAGSPGASLLYQKMTASFPCGSRMPADGTWSAAYESMMLDWINQGAHNN